MLCFDFILRRTCFLLLFTRQKKQLMMCLTHFQISRYFGTTKELTETEKLIQISKLLDFYRDGHQFNVDLTPTDIG